VNGKVLVFGLQILGCDGDENGEISMVMGMGMGNFSWGWGQFNLLCHSLLCNRLRLSINCLAYRTNWHITKLKRPEPGRLSGHSVNT